MKNWLTNELERFLREEEGLEMVEYAVVGGLLVAVGAGAWTLLGTEVRDMINHMASFITTP